MYKLINWVAKVMVVALAAMLSCSAASGAVLAKQTASKAPRLGQSYVWYDGNRKQTVWLNPQVVAEFGPGKQGASVAKSVDARARILPMKHKQAGVRLWQMDNTGDAAVRSLVTSNPAGKYSAVFHDGPNSAMAMRALPGNIIVYLNPTWDATMVDNWVKTRKLEVVKKLEIGPNIYVIKTAPGLEALTTANELYLSGEVSAAFPDWWQESSHR